MDKICILIVDDDPGLRKTLADILRVKGFEVLAAKNGTEGLVLLGENPVNLVIIDLGLPDIPGLEVLNRVKADYPSTEAIILTGNASLDSAMEATNRGAFSYLIKPYEMEQLMLQIRRAIEKQQAVEALRVAYLVQEQRSAELAEANRALEAEVAERKMAEDALKRSNHSLLLFSECNEVLVHAVNEAQLLNSICSEIVKTGGYRLAWVGYEEQGRLYPVAHAAHEGGCQVTPGRGGEGRRCSVAEAIDTCSGRDEKGALDRFYAHWHEQQGSHGCSVAISLPLKVDGRVFGTLNIHAAESEGFGGEDIGLFAELANDLSYGIVSLRSGIERKRAEDALRQRQRAIESSSNGIMITAAAAADYPIIYVNPAFERITGYGQAEALGSNARFLHGQDREQLGLEEVRAAIREQREGHAVLRNYRKDGSCFWNELSISPVRGENGEITNFVGVLNDITERKLYEEQLEYQTNHDGLTGLPNRNLLADRLNQALSYTDRYSKQAAVLFIDLDHFKFINDSLGHDTGDRLLKITAGRLTECVHSTDTVARHGGDEFVVVLSDLADGEVAAGIARKIQDAVYQPFRLGDHELMISCSTGISMYPADGEDASTLLKNADAAMYRAKEQGRNCFRFYTGEMNDKAVARMTMESHLRRALERGEFLLHYQPQVDLDSGRVIGMESLIRWQSPELGFISPANFIPLAEETGLIVPIGEWVVKTACAQNRAWQDAGFSPLIMAVNLSPRQFRQENLAGIVARILAETGLEPKYLELEIIESLIMHDVESAMVILNELKALGVQLTMDDFGTGYSSLSYLKRFPFDKLKIDQSFVRDITSDPDNAAIVRAIVAMGHSLDLRLIAEGIETAGELSYLRSLACDDMQGFYFSRPVPATEFEQMLREERRLEFSAETGGLHDKTLLLVDDDAHVLASLKRVLCDEGYTILTADGVLQGFELLALNRVGVVVSDLRMPEMAGTEFLSRVRELYPAAVRIMLSGHADMDSLTDTINRGAIYKFLVKPWDEELVRKNIRDAFRHHDISLGGIE